MTYFLAGAALGAAGSVHCAGMCGPLLLALHGTVPRAQMIGRMALYHAARVLTYALLGIPAGYAAHALSYGMFGRAIALIAGVALLFAAAGSLATRYGERVSRAWSAAVIRVAARAAKLTRNHPRTGYIALGGINGLLPCGLVYAAVAGAATSGNVAAATTFMLGFGAGTVPLLLAVTLSAASVPAALRHRLRIVAPALMVLAGLLLIARAVAPAAHTHRHAALEITEDEERTAQTKHGGSEGTEFFLGGDRLARGSTRAERFQTVRHH